MDTVVQKTENNLKLYLRDLSMVKLNTVENVPINDT